MPKSRDALEMMGAQIAGGGFMFKLEADIPLRMIE